MNRALLMGCMLGLVFAFRGPAAGGADAQKTGEGKDMLVKDSAVLMYRDVLTLPLPDFDKAKEEKLFLLFSGRINAKNFLSGSAPACQICVNGLPTSVERLRNKPRYYFFTPEERAHWYSPGVSAWLLPYYPWERRDVAGGQAHVFVLDITNLLKASGNALTIESLFNAIPDSALELRDIRLLRREDFPKSPPPNPPDPMTESDGLAEFRQKALGYHEGATAKLQTAFAFTPSAGLVAPRTDFKQAYELTLDPTGRIGIVVGGEEYALYSSFKPPQSEWLEIGTDDAAKHWGLFKAEGETVFCENPQIRLRRSIARKDSHVEIRDLIANKTNEDLPVVLLNCLDIGKVSDLSEFRIAGRPQGKFWANTSPIEGRQLGATPVVYAARKTSSVGVVMEDDAYRNQGSVVVWDNVLGLGDDMFYLAPGAEYTFVWKVYPIAGKDYYALLNALRHDWGLYQKIPGLFGFVHPTQKERMYEDVACKTPKEIAEFLASSGVRIAAASAVTPGKNPDKLEPVFGNEEIALLRKGLVYFQQWRTAAREGGAGVKCLPYLNVHLCRLVGDRTLEDVDRRLSGCLVKDAYGKPVAYRTGWLYCVLPTLENACGRHLLDVLRLYVDEAKFDGIYLDEWDHSRARVSFSHEDGMSAILDRDVRIVRKVGFVPILTKAFQVRFIQELVKRKATIFANQFDDTLTAAQLPVVHFAEPGGSYDEYLLYAAQAGRTPLALHIKRTQGIWTDAKEFLKRGILMCYYWKYLHGDHVLKRCYPITVKEIRPGVVIGDDRIVTCASGTFTLGHNKPLTGYIYGGPNGLLTKTVTETQQVNGRTGMELVLDSDQIAVIME